MSEELIAKETAFWVSGSGLRRSAEGGTGYQVSELNFTFRHHPDSIERFLRRSPSKRRAQQTQYRR
jgi:hypothetical protein